MRGSSVVDFETDRDVEAVSGDFFGPLADPTQLNFAATDTLRTVSCISAALLEH